MGSFTSGGRCRGTSAVAILSSSWEGEFRKILGTSEKTEEEKKRSKSQWKTTVKRRTKRNKDANPPSMDGPSMCMARIGQHGGSSKKPISQF
jgi:hypothetical protein